MILCAVIWSIYYRVQKHNKPPGPGIVNKKHCFPFTRFLRSSSSSKLLRLDGSSKGLCQWLIKLKRKFLVIYLNGGKVQSNTQLLARLRWRVVTSVEQLPWLRTIMIIIVVDKYQHFWGIWALALVMLLHSKNECWYLSLEINTF